MSSIVRQNGGMGHREQSFATTRWSIVIAAGQTRAVDSRRALASLCETYWLPVYTFVRRHVASVEDSQDLTQGFFAYLLDTDAIAKADPDRGRFRAFLLTALKNFMSNERVKANAKKRTGTHVRLSLDFDSGELRYQTEPSHDLTPEKLFERRWVLSLLDQVLDSLKNELSKAKKGSHFDHFKDALTVEMTNDQYEAAAESLGITAAAAKQAAYRMRKRYRELFRLEVGRTVADDSEINEEITRLLNTLH